MRRVADRFHDNLGLHPGESFKVFLFVVKAFASIGFLFVFGHIAATGTLSTTLLLILILAAVLDLLPLAMTVRMMGTMSDAARRAEKLQLLLKTVAYLVLLSVVSGVAASVRGAYTAFIILWLGSFLVEQSVMFLLEDGVDS